jgi:hypothetical protein
MPMVHETALIDEVRKPKSSKRLETAIMSPFRIVISLSLLASVANAGEATGIDYSIYDRLTRAYVDERGRVDYEGLKRELPVLRTFVDQLSAISPDSRPGMFSNDGERLRYYVTAYNAWVLYIAASEYPSRSSLWNWLGLFRNRDIKLGGRDTTLNDLEHGIIRKRFQDPRIHFYINCAAASCPGIERGAIPEGKTDEALERAARRFINDPAHVRYDAAAGRLYLSKIFDWFEEDFFNFLRSKRGEQQPHIAQYILLYLQGPARQALAKFPMKDLSVRYLDYDKSLNEQKGRN